MSENRKRHFTLVLARLFICATVTVLILGAAAVFAGGPSSAASPADQAMPRHAPGALEPAPDLIKQPTLYTVGYAHLDTQWRWDYVKTINEYIPATMRLNFALFEKYPHYVFNFSGANRYRMMREYYPADFAMVKKYVAAGRWFPCGSSMEENDPNATSAESIIRQVLYGTQYFRREFGFTSAEYMLPDCFGFPASLPSILAHCGLKGFSTQKLVWGSLALVGGPNSTENTPVGVPFNVGVWEGPDGRSVLAALNPGDYGSSITYDLSKTPPPPPPPTEGRRRRPAPEIDWPARIDLDGMASGLFADYRYYGTGDIGGSPTEASVKLLEEIVIGKGGVGAGPVHVVSAKADQMFLDIKPGTAGRLPRYKGDLELTNHTAGSITSQAYMKRWNRWNEVLADGAERASLAAEWLGGRAYPLSRLNAAWTLVMGGQFHDILPGTSIPKAYEYSWNDEQLAMNQFAGVLTDAAGVVASVLDTRVKGTAVVVYNPLNVEREDIVEAAVDFPGAAPRAVRVTGPDGKAVPAQIAGGKVIFPARVPSVGFAVYDVGPAAAPSAVASALKVSESWLENERYRVAIDRDGDVLSIFDKALGKELLYSPARLEIKTDRPHDWPAWNMDWADQSRPARSHVRGPAKVRVVESGPARVAVEVAREAEGSRFVQTIRLAAGDAGNRVEFRNAIDWLTKEAHLKAVFPLTAQSPVATYNWDIGTIERSTDNPREFEFPSHQWVDLTDQSGSYGVTVLSDAKYGSDKPDDNTIRLTLVRTPGIGAGNGKDYADQTTQDWGHHEFVYGLAGHAGDFRQGQTDWQALRLNQPLLGFQSPAHEGALGKSFSLMSVSNGRIRALALKKAEQGDEIVLRLVEMDGRPAQGVSVRFASPVTAAREVTGAETPVGAAAVTEGAVVADFSPFQVRSFALKIGPASTGTAALQSQPVALSYDLRVASRDGTKVNGGFDGSGGCLAAEMLPAEVPYGGIRFRLGSPDKSNAVTARGQKVSLPPGGFTRLYVLAASAGGDRQADFRVGDKTASLTIQDWGGYIGQWDNRIWKTHEVPVSYRPGERVREPGEKPLMQTVMEYVGLTPGFVKTAPVAWFASHRHSAGGENEAYAYSYLFAYAIDIPANATALTLPNDEKIRVLAMTAAKEGEPVRPVQPLVDRPDK